MSKINMTHLYSFFAYERDLFCNLDFGNGIKCILCERVTSVAWLMTALLPPSVSFCFPGGPVNSILPPHPPTPWSCDTYRIINPNQQQTATALLDQCHQPDKDSTPHLRNNLQFYTFLLHWPKKYCIKTKAMISSEKMSRQNLRCYFLITLIKLLCGLSIFV